MISLDYQDDENIEKHPHLNWVVVLVDLNSKSTIEMLITLITFFMIKIVIGQALVEDAEDDVC